MTAPDDTTQVDKLSQQNAVLVRDFMDLASALGVAPSFAAVSQRIAELLTLERSVRLKEDTLPVAPQSKE